MSMDDDNTVERRFTEIYRTNFWRSAESRSGVASEVARTAYIRREIPILFKDFGIASLLDAPCGDFNWMKLVPLAGIAYAGIDIVAPLIDLNNRLYGSATRRFLHLNIMADILPRADLILCRDCLFHFSHEDVFRTLRNFKASGSRYLLTTTFLNRSFVRNYPIRTGAWTFLNLELPPFSFPPPLRTILEFSTEINRYPPNHPDWQIYREDAIPHFDRSLCLWKLEDIPIPA